MQLPCVWRKARGVTCWWNSMRGAMEPAGPSATIWVFLPHSAWSAPQLQIQRLWIPHSKCQQGDCHPMRIWLEGTFGSHSLSHPPGWFPVLNQVCCGLSSRKLNPPPSMEVPPIPLVICPWAAHFPHDEIFPNIPQFVIFAPYCTTSDHQEEFGSVIFTAALQETGGCYYIYLLVMPVLCCWH